MLALGSLSFLMPWLLAALAAVPALWWILRVSPPRPRQLRFPGYFFLRDLQAPQKSPAKTPWWLLLMRCLIVVCLILAMAEPVTRLVTGAIARQGPVLLLVDNGWSSAVNWDKRLRRMQETLQPLAREGRSVILLPTAPSPDQPSPQAIGPISAEDALAQAASLAPQPWPAAHAAAEQAAAEVMARAAPAKIVFFSDGTARSVMESQSLMRALQAAAPLTVVDDSRVNRPLLLRRDAEKPGQLAFTLDRPQPDAKDEALSLVATDDGGAVLDELRFVFPAGEKSYRIDWSLAEDLRGKVARVALREPQTAGTVYLTDTQWRQRPVGILADAAQKNAASFLNEVYYLKRALETEGALAMGTVDELLKQERAVIIWPDSAPLPPADQARLDDWVQKGGFLIRFAGPSLAANAGSALLPVRLREGQRALEGAMTWEKPARLSPINEDSPFYGLDIPDDVTVTRQVLAAPEPETFARTWLQLTDGTPLVTGGAFGNGAIALVHTTAGPDWSNFCYSGFYVDVLRRMIALSRGISDYKGALVLAPVLVLDGAGRLQSPSPSSLAGPVDGKPEFEPSPRTPPGIYGDSRQFRVFALGDALSGLYPLPALPAGAEKTTYDVAGEKNYKHLLLAAAVMLMLADLAATLWLRGVVTFGRAPRTAAIVLCALTLAATPAMAQDARDEALRFSKINLAYVESGDPAADQVSLNGLQALGRVLSARTTIQVQDVVGVDPEVDQLSMYPFLYWPMTQAQRPLSLTAAQAVQNYISHGGLIVFDTRDQQFGDISGETIGTRRLRELTADLTIPALTPVESGHILTKSFYLLDNFPGAYAGGKVWVEKEPNPNYDDVTSIIVGGNDWAAAWSEDGSDRARFPVTPGGEKQREMAYRVGVNIAMIAMAGNYKADQVHVPFILERMKK